MSPLSVELSPNTFSIVDRDVFRNPLTEIISLHCKIGTEFELSSKLALQVQRMVKSDIALDLYCSSKVRLIMCPRIA